MSAPNAGAVASMGRARGGETAHLPATGRVGPASPALTSDMETSRSQRPPPCSAPRQASAAAKPVSGSAMASPQNSGSPPRQTTRPPAAPASSPNATRSAESTGAPVAGDGDPHPGTSVPHDVLGLESQLPQGPRTAGFDHDVGSPDQPVQRPDPLRAPQVERDRTLATVQEVEESLCAAPRAVGPLGRLDLHDVCARLGQEVAAEWAGPQRREVEHQQSGRVTTRRRRAERRSQHAGALTRLAHPGDGQPEQPRPLQQLTGIAVPDAPGHLGPQGGGGGGHGVELQPRRHQLHVLGSRERHRHEPVRTGQQPATPAAAGRAAPPESHEGGALAEEGQRVQLVEAGTEAVDALHETGGWPERGVDGARQRHRSAGRPALHRAHAQ